MKKFVFSLATLFDMKKTLKDKLQAEYAEARAALDNAVRKKEGLEKILDDKSAEYEEKARKGMKVNDIRDYSVYLEDLQGQIKSAGRDVERARRNADIKQGELVAVFKEIKVLEKLHEKQYREFLAEEGKSETKAVEDILSFNITERPKESDDISS